MAENKTNMRLILVFVG